MSKSWSTTTRYFVLAILVIGAVWFVNASRALVGTLAISALLAYILNPVITYANRYARLSRSWVTILVYLLSIGGLVAIAIVFVPLIPEQSANLTAELQDIILQIEQSLPDPIVFLGTSIPLSTVFPDLSDVAAISTITNLVQPGAILDVLQATSTNFGWVLVILVTTYYLLQDWESLKEWMFSLAPPDYEGDMRRLYEEIRLVWNRYFQGQLRLMLIVGVMTGLMLAAVGLPGAVVFGLFAGIFDLLLSVGPAIVMVVSMVFALYSGSTFLDIPNVWFMLIVMTIYGIVQMAENIWLRPRIMSNTLRMHPAVVFIAIIGSLALSGVLVALIIIPVLGSIGVIGRYVHSKLFDLETWPEPTVLKSPPPPPAGEEQETKRPRLLKSKGRSKSPVRSS